MSEVDALKFCIGILPQVSRTFALNIRVLRGDLYKAVLCAYLFCRIVDTVEDSVRLVAELRNRLLDEYASLFTRQDFSANRVRAWVELFGDIDESDAEQRLVRDCALVFETFFTLPEFSRQAVSECVVEMALGMKETVNLKAEKTDGLHALRTLADLDQYCYYVAGTVGKMLTRLFRHYLKSLTADSARKMEELQISFALGLQLTNIVKDCFADYQRGWCYIPGDLAQEHRVPVTDFFNPDYRTNSQQVLNFLIRKAARNLDDALTYTLLLPRREVRMRLFNLWSLFFAIKTLGKAWDNEDLLSGEREVKISRLDVYRTLFRTAVRVLSNSLLRRAYQKLRTAISAE